MPSEDSSVTRGVDDAPAIDGSDGADLGAYIQASTHKVVTNNNTPHTHGCIALGPSGNRQVLLKCFDIETGMFVVRRIAKQILWSDRMLKIASGWGCKSKNL